MLRNNLFPLYPVRQVPAVPLLALWMKIDNAIISGRRITDRNKSFLMIQVEINLNDRGDRKRHERINLCFSVPQLILNSECLCPVKLATGYKGQQLHLQFHFPCQIDPKKVQHNLGTSYSFRCCMEAKNAPSCTGNKRQWRSSCLCQFSGRSTIQRTKSQNVGTVGGRTPTMIYVFSMPLPHYRRKSSNCSNYVA